MLRSVLGSAAIKVANALLGFGVAVVLARALGADGYGVYSTAFVIASVLAILVQFGLPNLVLRETAAAEADGDWARMKAIWVWATRGALLFSLAVLAIAAATGFLLRGRYAETDLWTFFLALGLVPLFALGALRAAALRGLRHIVLSQIPEMILKPGLLLLLALLLGAAVPAEPAYAMLAQLVAAAAAFAAGAVLLWRRMPEGVRRAARSSVPSRGWWMASSAMAVSAGMNQINNYADILILGLFRPAEEVGLYRVAYQVSMLALFGQQAVAMVFTPRFVRLYQQGDTDTLQRLVTLMARLSLLVALPLFFLVAFFGDTIFTILFGLEFSEAHAVAVVLVLAQVITSYFAAIGYLLNMCGQEKSMAKILMLTAGLNILMNFVMIPVAGMMGAALATLLSLLVWNLTAWRVGRLRLGLDCSAASLVR